MPSLHTIVREVSQIVMTIGVLGYSLYLMRHNIRRASDQREQKANIQNRFNGKE
jgi:hypothetical protein